MEGIAEAISTGSISQEELLELMDSSVIEAISQRLVSHQLH
jgi:hypothetical protein